MMEAVRGIYRSGVVELPEQLNVVGPVEAVATSSTMNATFAPPEDFAVLLPASIAENAPRLDAFAPIAPAKPIRLSGRPVRGSRPRY